jgi:phospholipase C
MAVQWKLAAGALVLVAAGCGGQMQPASSASSGTSQAFVPAMAPKSKSSQIKYVVMIVQENRTPDNLFQGLKGADIATSGLNSQGQTVQLHEVPLEVDYDMNHQHESFVTEWFDGHMNGFNLNTHKGHCRVSQTCAYGYVPKYENQPYVDLASQYAFADRMFESNQGPSFPAHQYIISGTSTTDSTGEYKAADNPYSRHGPNGGGCDAPPYVLVDTINQSGTLGNPVYPCFDRQTLGDLLDQKAISWRYYQMGLGVGLWHPFDAISHIRHGKDYANVVTPSSQVLTDISTGKLAQVSWVSPAGSNSDHSGDRSSGGPAWVSSIVNAIGASKYWNQCAVFVVWDDWGGWYDHVSPPIYNSYELGFRVPLIAISPYAKKGYVSETQYEFGSLLKFVEQTFGTGNLGTTDVRAASVSDMFNFKQRPRSFVRIKAPRYTVDPTVPDSD